MQDDQFSHVLGPVGARVQQNNQSQWAVENFVSVVQECIQFLNARNVMEVGGGRAPTFSEAQIATLGCSYTVNDISQRELDRAPSYVSKARFDIGTADKAEIAPFAGQYDFIFSKMVFEHVKHADRAYRNVHTLLADGGVCLNLHPVLYSLPFVVNWLLPDSLSRKVLRIFQNSRNDEGIPKFPAHYSMCSISRGTRERLKACGFSSVHQQAFFNHSYFRRIPPIYKIDQKIGNFFARRQVNAMASFSYTVVLK